MKEYRVLWQREGQKPKHGLYQTRSGALRCAERQKTASEEMTWLDPRLPRLVGLPKIEARDVGPWQPVNAIGPTWPIDHPRYRRLWALIVDPEHAYPEAMIDSRRLRIAYGTASPVDIADVARDDATIKLIKSGDGGPPCAG